MKSEFLLAFNQICSERGLPPEVVLDALRTALVSAYRRNVNISSAQNVAVEIDPATGQASIFVEKSQKTQKKALLSSSRRDFTKESIISLKRSKRSGHRHFLRNHTKMRTSC